MKKEPTQPRINCYACESYYVTWDQNMPHGCKKLGFKSRMMPSREVWKNSGMPCMYFTEKHRKN